MQRINDANGNQKDPNYRNFLNLEMMLSQEANFMGKDQAYPEFFFGFKNEFISKHGGSLNLKKLLIAFLLCRETNDAQMYICIY